MNERPSQAEKLQALFRQLELRGKDAAGALALDPGLVSKWLNGRRVLRLDSGNLERLADYALTRELTQEQLNWLKKTLRADGIRSEFGSMSDIKLGLVLWLADEGDPSIRFLIDKIINDESSDVSSEKYRFPKGSGVRLSRQDFACRAGDNEIALQLRAMLENASGFVDICLSGENAAAIAAPPIRSALTDAMVERDIRFRLLVTVSGRSETGAQILSLYLRHILQSRISLYFDHAGGAAGAEQTSICVPCGGVMLISEVPGAGAPLVATVVTEPSFVKAFTERLDRAIGFSRSAFSPLRSMSTRRVQRMCVEDYETPGGIAVLRRGLTAYYMPPEAFERLLSSLGYAGDALGWRKTAFVRHQEALLNGLRRYLSVTELVPVDCLLPSRADENGETRYRVNGDAFMELGCVEVDARAMADIAEGYVHIIREYPNLHVRLLDPALRAVEDTEMMLKGPAKHLIVRRDDELQPLLYAEEYVLLKVAQDMLEELLRHVEDSPYASMAAIQSLESLSRALRAQS